MRKIERSKSSLAETAHARPANLHTEFTPASGTRCQSCASSAVTGAVPAPAALPPRPWNLRPVPDEQEGGL